MSRFAEAGRFPRARRSGDGAFDRRIRLAPLLVPTGGRCRHGRAGTRRFHPPAHGPHATFDSLTSIAPVKSTDTSWLTPRSYIVTPNSRFMRAMVMGL